MMINNEIKDKIMRSFTSNKLNMNMMSVINQRAKSNIFKKTFDMVVDDDSSDFDRDDLI